MNITSQHASSKRGFTLLELLIVIAIIAILSVVVVLVLNPAETLRKTRDAQRISDTNTLKTALGLYLTTVTTPYLAGASDNTECQAGADGWTGETGTGGIFYSTDEATANIADTTIDGVTFTTTGTFQAATAVAAAAVDGTGWLPVNFGTITGGSPISNLPQDPVNDPAFGTSDLTAMTAEGLVYRYACHSGNMTFEINARLESQAYTTGAENKYTSDGGNSTLMYEVGTKLDILGANSAAAANAAGF